MSDRIAVEVIRGGQDAFLEFLLRCDADVGKRRGASTVIVLADSSEWGA